MADNTLHTWINDELVTVDRERVWADAFADWDRRVPTDLAAAIATAIDRTIRDYMAREAK